MSKDKTTPGQFANMVEAEALRRAVLAPDSFLPDDITTTQVRKVRMILAKRYDKLVAKRGLDTHELLAERVAGA